jgi:hypothetical protein
MSQYWGTGRLGATLATSFSTTLLATTAVGSQTRRVRVIATSACYVSFGTTTVSSGDAYFPANVPEYITVTPGQKISAQSSVTASSGYLFVTEVS